MLTGIEFFFLQFPKIPSFSCLVLFFSCATVIQWRANASQYLGETSFCLDKENWGWSWLQHWVAARPWEIRVETNHPNKGRIKQVNRSNKSKRISELKIIPVSDNASLCNLY